MLFLYFIKLVGVNYVPILNSLIKSFKSCDIYNKFVREGDIKFYWGLSTYLAHQFMTDRE